MDVIGAVGYNGQKIVFFDHGLLAYVTGKSICVVDVSIGPRELIWRFETGIQKIIINSMTQRFAILPAVPEAEIEILSLSDQRVTASLPNPSRGCVVDGAFSRQGDRLVCVSDTLDRKVFVYDVNSKTLILVSDLSKNLAYCTFNPADNNQIFLSGVDGLCAGNLVDLTDTFIIKFHEFKLTLSGADSDPNSISGPTEIMFNDDKYRVTFVVWVPIGKVIVGTGIGQLFEIDTTSGNVRPLGLIVSASPHASPRAAVLTLESLIVGLSDGAVLWFSLSNLLYASNTKLNDQLEPLQTSQLNGSVTSLVVDPTFQKLFVGTTHGIISKFNVDTANLSKTNADGEEDGMLDEGAENAEHSISVVMGDNVCVFQEGAVLCSAAMSVPIIGTSTAKIAKKSTHLLPLLVTGSHFGRVCFWKQPSVDTEAITQAHFSGVRKSTPRALRLLSTQPLSSGSSPCCFSSLPTFINDGCGLVGVGTSTGCLEVFKFDALEMDDEDEEGGAGEAAADVDEDGVKFSVWPVARYQLFTRSVTSIARASDWDSKGGSNLVAVSSFFDSRVFILKEDDKDSFDIVMQLNLELGPAASVSSLCWSGTHLHVCSRDGYVCTFASTLLISLTQELDKDALAYCSPETIFKSDFQNVMGGISVPGLGQGDSLSQVALLIEDSAVVCLNHVGRALTSAEPSEDGGESVSTADTTVNSSVMDRTTLASGTVGSFQLTLAFGQVEHSDVVVVSAMSPNRQLLATGCASGNVYVWTLKKSRMFSLLARARIHHAAVISLCFSVDSALLLSCSADGSIFVCGVDRPSPVEYEFETSRHSVRARKFQHSSAPFIVQPSDSFKQWIDEKQQAQTEKLKASYVEKVAELQENVGALANRLKIMLERNNDRSDLEKMDRSEFVVDVPLRDSIVDSSVDYVNNLREIYRLRVYWNELNAARIRVSCWDSMQVHSRSVIPFASSEVQFVSSFAIPKVSDKDAAILTKVKRLRAIEIRSQKVHPHGLIQKLPNEGKIRACWASNVQGTSSQISWVAGDGSLWPTSEVSSLLIQKEIDSKAAENQGGKDAKKDANAAAAPVPGAAPGAVVNAPAEDDDEKSLSSHDNHAEYDENDIFNLLYSPQTIRTDVQKRMHVILLKEAVRQIKIKFNEHFEKLAREKEETVGAIDSRNSRIQAILEELHQNEEINRPEMADVEKVGSAIEVFESEIASRPFETESMKQARLREEEEARRREAGDEKKEAMTRALVDMMHGSLEVKRNVFDEASSLTRPAWMDETPEADMTEAQLKEYDSFNAKYRALQEEQSLYRKQLEQELKRLKTEIVDVSKTFDEKVVSLARIKVQTSREVLTHELYMARIANSVLKIEQSWAAIKEFDAGIEQAKKSKKELQIKIDKFSSHCEETRGALNIVQDEERQMDKSFKKDIQAFSTTVTFDQETLKILTQLFRMRNFPHDESEDDNAGGNEPETSHPDGKRPSKRNSQHSRGSFRGAGGKAAGAGRRSATGQMGGSASSGNQHTASKRVGAGKMRASKGRSSGQAGSGMNMGSMGPMQEAAQLIHQSVADKEKQLAAERDPFFAALVHLEKVKRAQEMTIPLLDDGLNKETDCPEGIPNLSAEMFSLVFSKLDELRKAKISKEIQSKLLSIKFNEMKAKLDEMRDDEATVNKHIASLRSSKEEMTILLNHLQTDLELVVQMRQGQDEINKDAIVTDYSDAICIPVSVVSKFNSRIKEIGKDKIGVLSKIKTFRRKINLVDWEAKHLALECKHLEEYFTDLQLFRVTRELQQILRDGSDAEQTKERLDKVALRKDFMQKDSELKIIKLRRTKEQMKKQLIERTEEISNLEKKVVELKSQVLARKSVRQSRDDARGSGDSLAQNTNKMKKIKARRQLVDTAKAQAEEIDFLRQELDKVRQKTFPSFIRAVKKRLPNPDERL